MLVLVWTGVISLQSLPKLANSFTSGIDNNIEHFAFALANGKPITQKLDYAHFLPLTNNTKLHQVKVIVDYVPISAAQYAYMKVYAPNGSLIKTSSSPNGLKTIAPGKAQFATTIPDSTLQRVTAFIMFTGPFRNANYSNPINVKLNLGQIVEPSTPKSVIPLR
jgi:hypothetical protein